MSSSNFQQLFDSKINLLNEILALLKDENYAVNSDDGDLLDLIIEKQNNILINLKEIDEKIKNLKTNFSDIQQKALLDYLLKIEAQKKINIDIFANKFETFKKQKSTVFYNRELMNTYFHRVPLNPRFIDKKIQ